MLTDKPNLPAPFSYRPAKHLAHRFFAAVKVTRRTRASILTEGLEKVLPPIEKKFAPQLAALKKDAA